MVYVRQARGTMEEVQQRVEEATVAHKFGVIAVHDLRAKMEAKGVTFRQACRIVEVCNPLQAKQVLKADMIVSTALPCRISIYEEDNVIKVATLKPTALLELLNIPSVEPIAKEVEETIIRIIDQACG
jgi:uncharacterized protein (DUF302 family)